MLDVAGSVPGQLPVPGDLRHAHGLPAQRQDDGRAAPKLHFIGQCRIPFTYAKVLENNNYPATFDRAIKI